MMNQLTKCSLPTKFFGDAGCPHKGNFSPIPIRLDDPLVRHQLRSQEAEERMHFMEGKYQIDAYALTPEDQKPIEEVFDFLLRPWAPQPSRALGGSK
jgi:hypothetical protein